MCVKRLKVGTKMCNYVQKKDRKHTPVMVG